MEVRDAQGINLYEERPFEKPEVLDKKKRDDAAVGADAQSPAAHSIGGLSGGGFTSADGLRDHLLGSNLGDAIKPMLEAGKIVLHDTDANIPGRAPTAKVGRYSVAATPSDREFLAGDPVASMDGNEVPRFEKMAEIVQWAVDYFAEKVGSSIVHADIGSVRLDRRGVKDSLGHGYGPAKVQALHLLPEVLDKAGVLAVESRAHGEQGYLLGAPVDIDGKHHILAILGKRTANRTGLYVHEVLLTEKFRGASNTAVPAQAGQSRGNPGTIHNIIGRIFDVNESNAKVVSQVQIDR